MANSEKTSPAIIDTEDPPIILKFVKVLEKNSLNIIELLYDIETDIVHTYRQRCTIV